MLTVGVAVALVLIGAVTLLQRAAEPDPTIANVKVATISPTEALTIVAQSVRSSAAAEQVLSQGQARFADGAWDVTVGEAQFHFTQRNRIVIAQNQAAVELTYSGAH